MKKIKATASARAAMPENPEAPGWFLESLASINEAAGRPSLPQVILGPALYAKARALGCKGGLTTSDLLLGVIWFEAADREDIRALVRSEKWFMAAAGRLVKQANRTRKAPRAMAPKTHASAQPNALRRAA